MSETKLSTKLIRCCLCKKPAGKNIRFRSFPTKEPLKGKWLQALKLQDFGQVKKYKVCSYHFTPEDYKISETTGKKILRLDSVPSIALDIIEKTCDDETEIIESDNEISFVDALECVQVKYSSKKSVSWDKTQMEAAIEAVKDGRKIKEVSKSFMVPESTLRYRYIKAQYEHPRMGPKTTFSKEEEQELADQVLVFSKTTYGITKLQLRKLAYEFALQKNIKNIFSADKGLAGNCWMYSFLKRHPEIQINQKKNKQLLIPSHLREFLDKVKEKTENNV